MELRENLRARQEEIAALGPDSQASNKVVRLIEGSPGRDRSTFYRAQRLTPPVYPLWPAAVYPIGALPSPDRPLIFLAIAIPVFRAVSR